MKQPLAIAQIGTAHWRISGSIGAALLLLLSVLLLALPTPTHAAGNQELGGGNALLHAVRGIAHATSTSQLMTHLLFASTHGGKPTEVPPPGSTAEGTDGTPAPQANGLGEEENGNAEDVGSGNGNGGASAGNGGNGGNGGVGGLVRAGSVVSNAHALNILNTTIVRVGR